MSTEPDVLEQNVSTLLETGGEAPRLSPVARERIKANLLARHGVAATAPRASGFWRARTLAIGGGLLAVAAAIALLLASRDAGTGLVPGAPVDTALALADGTTVVRDQGATVTVLGPRHVRVTGAALLDVAPGKGTFVVETARGTIEVLGTRFLVDAESQRTTAAVVRGSVKLTSDTGAVLLHAGEQGIAEPGKVPTRGPASRLSHLVSWAQATRRKLEHAEPVHHGTLFARPPNIPNAAEEPLPLARLSVDVVVENQVARVALDQTFHNPAPAELEGMYRFAIPPDAALQRLAMYVDGRLTESAVVERMAARRIYEEQVYRRVDPALLEWAGTGRLALRVYPLHAQQDKRLVLAYTQSLPRLYDDWTLTVPLPEVDQPVGELGFHVRVKGCANCELTSPSHAITVARAGDDAVVSYTQANAQAGDSLVLHVRDSRHAPTIASYTDGQDRYVMVRASADLTTGPVPYRPRTWVILDDVSASRDAMARRAQSDLVDGFLRELDEDDRVAVVAFDVTARVALPATRVRDVDRAAVRKALADEGDVGATDVGVALDAALAQLGGAAPEDAMVVYLGDGVITSGTRHLDELRGKLVGKAHFVGVGIGDGPDTQTLDALAAATGGYATTIDLADDVGWRAFDLVAALHTARVTELGTRLIDASGAPIPATLYAPAQLADGEELELVGKLAAAATPVAVELTGTLGGQPWTRRIALDTSPHSTSSAADAGYLPRVWAQRHIAARLLAKHEPVDVPPCGTASRATPVPCKTETELRDARDEVIRREVVELGKRYFLLSRHTSLLVLENAAMYAQYGIAPGAGETWAPYVLPATIPSGLVATVAPTATATPATIAPDAELVRQGPPLFYAPPTTRYPSEPLGGSRRADKEVGDALDSDREAPRYRVGPLLTAAPADRPSHGEMKTEENGVMAAVEKSNNARDLMPDEAAGRSAVEAQQARASTVAFDATGGGYLTRDKSTSGVPNGGFGAYGPTMPLIAQRYVAPTDAAFDDLTAFVPALFPDAADAWRTALAAAGDAAGPHPIDALARTRLATARATLPSGVYRWGELEIAVDDARRLGWRRTTDTDLAETASFDGATWTRRYAELGLDATRAVGDDDVALALGYLPVWIAAPEHWAKSFTVRARGDREVVLARGDRVAYVLAFDAASRLTSVHDGAGQELVAVTWSASGPIAARVRGEPIAVGFTGQAIADAPAWAHRDAPASAVVIELPTRVPDYWEAQRVAATPGSPAWRRATHQHLASLAAIHAAPRLMADYRELVAHGGAELGDLVLASEGIGLAATAADRVALPHLAASRYLIGGRDAGADRLAVHAVVEPGFLGALAVLRDVATELAAGRSGPAAARLAELGERAPLLRLLGATALQNRGGRPADAARAWDTFASGPYHNVARAAAALAYQQQGQADEAAARYAALAADYDLQALPVSLGMARYVFQQSRRGVAGWDIAAAQLRDRVLPAGSFEQVLLLVAATDSQADHMRILARAAELANGDPARIATLARTAADLGELVWASQLVQPALQSSPTRDLAQLAGQLALQQGRPADALAALEQAQTLGADEAAPIGVVRAELGQLISVAQRVAVASTGAAREDAVARALRWGKRWRAIDPGNAQTDMALGDLMLGVGDPAEAWRQMSTMIERNPMSGDGYEAIANIFEREGKVAEALDYWEQALRIDQTDPTPRLRKAQALFALGRTREGTAALRDILDRRWHERWEWTVESARELLAERRP